MDASSSPESAMIHSPANAPELTGSIPSLSITCAALANSAALPLSVSTTFIPSLLDLRQPRKRLRPRTESAPGQPRARRHPVHDFRLKSRLMPARQVLSFTDALRRLARRRARNFHRPHMKWIGDDVAVRG